MSRRDRSASRIIIPIALIAFFLFLARWFLGLSNGDDSLYMGDATHLQLSILIAKHDWGPLYVLWFKLVSLVCHDPIARYFVSWGLLVTLVALIPTFFRRPAAWLYTLILLTLPLATEGPYVGLFASAMMLASLCWLLDRRPSFAEAACAACVLSFCMKLSRPEYNYGVLICAAATLVAVLVERLNAHLGSADRPVLSSKIPASGIPAWILSVIPIAISAIMIYLLRKFPSHRSGMAFAQHFNIRSTLRGVLAPSPDSWASNYAELRFGVDTSHNALNGTAMLGDFFRANPRLFLGHIFYNLTDPHAIFLMALVLAVVLVPWLKRDAVSLRPASLFMLLLSVPPLAGSLVIFPHTHYAAVLVPSLTIFALQLLNVDRWLQPSIPWVLVPGFAILTYLYIVKPHEENAFMPYGRRDIYRLECVRQWDQPASPSRPYIFSENAIPPVYLDASRIRVFPSEFSTWDQFQTWATQTQPAWISIDTPESAVYGYPSLAVRYGVSQQQLTGFLQKDLGYIPHPCSADAQLTVYTPGRP